MSLYVTLIFTHVLVMILGKNGSRIYLTDTGIAILKLQACSGATLKCLAHPMCSQLFYFCHIIF